MVYFKKNYNFKVPKGVQHFQGGGPTFPWGGGGGGLQIFFWNI